VIKLPFMAVSAETSYVGATGEQREPFMAQQPTYILNYDHRNVKEIVAIILKLAYSCWTPSGISLPPVPLIRSLSNSSM
jgi:hypothetical protein